MLIDFSKYFQTRRLLKCSKKLEKSLNINVLVWVDYDFRQTIYFPLIPSEISEF